MEKDEITSKEALISNNLSSKVYKNAVRGKMAKNIDVILSFFPTKERPFYTPKELKKVYNNCIKSKYIYANTTFGTFEKFLKQHDIFTEKFILPFPIKTYTRYFTYSPSIYELTLSINKNAYLSHYSAVFLHNLTNNIVKSIFIDIEKSKPLKEIPQKEISQNEIDIASYRPPRISTNIITYKIYTINLLSRKYTNNLGVITKNIDGYKAQVTNIERTLIDITVSPHYCGGCYEVLNVYRKAKGKFKIKDLAETLFELNYIYPYHQAIGFFLEKAGYSESDLKIFDSMEKKNTFFVQRELKLDERKYDKRWNLFYPEFL